jgi:uncharacterized caspase-like protein
MIRTSILVASVIGGLALAIATPGDAFAAKRVALIVGNSAYQNAAKLPNPVRDAGAIADMFKKAGFDVSEKRDVGNLDFKRALREFRDAAATADVAVLYYAGHGIELNGTNYLVPVDARLKNSYDAEDEAVTLERVFQAIEPAKRLKLVILDACRDNPFIKKMERNIASRAVVGSGGLGKVDITISNTLIAYAARAGSTAEDGDGDHSPFTTALLSHLTRPGLDVRNAFGYVRDDVMKATANQQEPFIYGSLGGGNISLVPEPEKPAAPAASSADSIRADYQLAEKVGTREIWQSFLQSHPNGFYADLARAQIKKLDSVASLTATTPPIVDTDKVQRAVPPVEAPPPAANAPSSDEQRAWDKLKDSSDVAAIKKFIDRYPRSPLAIAAQHRVEILERMAKEREDKARVEREAAKQREEETQRAKAAEAEKQRLEREAAKRKEEDDRKAKAAADAEKQRLEREAAKRKEEDERRAKADTAERERLDREAAKRRDEDDRKAKAAEAERQRLEAAVRREEEDRKARAAEAERERQKQEAAKAADDKAQQEAAKAAEEKAKLEAAKAADEKAKKEAAKPADDKAKQEAARTTEDSKKSAQDEKRKAEEAERKKTAAREAEEEKRDAERKRKAQAAKEQQREASQRQERARNQASNSSRSHSGGGGGGAPTMTGVGF